MDTSIIPLILTVYPQAHAYTPDGVSLGPLTPSLTIPAGGLEVRKTAAPDAGIVCVIGVEAKPKSPTPKAAFAKASAVLAEQDFDNPQESMMFAIVIMAICISWSKKDNVSAASVLEVATPAILALCDRLDK